MEYKGYKIEREQMKEFFKTKTLFKIIIFLAAFQVGEWIAYLILFIREALLCKC